MFRRLDVRPGRLRTAPAGARNFPGYPPPRPSGQGRASADAGESGRVPGPSSVRVGAYRIRPPNIPQGMNDHTRGRVFATDGGAWGAYAIRPYTGYDHSPQHLNKPTGPQAPTSQPAARPEHLNKPTGPQALNISTGRRPPTPQRALRPAITIRSYRYIPFNIFFDSTEKRTIFVANFHVRCR